LKILRGKWISFFIIGSVSLTLELVTLLLRTFFEKTLLILNIIVKRVTPDQPTTVITPECISLYIFCDEYKISS
ncbi:TPA: hypothetical protein ACM7GJ_004972, partial [Escherichia coli]